MWAQYCTPYCFISPYVEDNRLVITYTFPSFFTETQRPEIDPLQSVAKIIVPAEAANSMVGFKDTVITVDEGVFTFYHVIVA